MFAKYQVFYFVEHVGHIIRLFASPAASCVHHRRLKPAIAFYPWHHNRQSGRLLPERKKESVFDSFHAIDTQIKLEGKKPQLSGFKHILKQEAHFYNSQFIGFMKHLAVNSSG